MSLYDIDFNQQGRLLLPPKKRKPKMLAWIYALFKPLQWNRDRFFNVFTGSDFTLQPFDSGNSYSYGDMTIWPDNSVYECLNPTPESGSTSSPALKPDNWYKLQDCFIGVDERLTFNSQIIVFEYALNRWFNNLGSLTQIYIVNNVTYSDFFLMGETSAYSSAMSVSSIFSSEFMGEVFTPGTQYDFTIKVPSALYVSVGESAIRAVADKYNTFGISYNVEVY